MGTLHALGVQPVADRRHGARGGLGVDRDAHQLGAGARQLRTWRTVASTSAVSVLVMDWTTMGSRRPG